MLSFGGLMNEIINAGSTTLSEQNPALVKVLGGFVFPTGFVLCVHFFLARWPTAYV
jgi:formate/nitrite transporter FocA (FNT family)